ncbi:uncharacterized protein LOC130968626 isoform X1 [Arachis stenosperma]|uniref:uncharacterized protein LOC130968626 isoform X1 n=1 Tax=Arachis stenosperma TaxID=217475 RepID=UPI0025AB8AE0|nr:uncharacterized protein LOC130968626 isoform X1 [Arachis stenosperma]
MTKLCLTKRGWLHGSNTSSLIHLMAALTQNPLLCKLSTSYVSYEIKLSIHSDMYIRVKRSKTTYFIRCKPTDKILDIKLKLQELVDQPANNQRLIIPATGEVLEDSRTLADQKVENDAVVALTLRKDDNEFEEVNIVRPNDFYQARDADGANW